MKEAQLLSIKTRLGRASTVGILTVASVAGFMTPASAAPVSSGTVGLARVATATLPNVNIQGAPAAWHPASLKVTPKSYTKCTAAKEVWTISNKTKKSQTISFKLGSAKKKELGKLAAGTKAGVCSKGPAGTKFTFSIKGSKSTLTLTLS